MIRLVDVLLLAYGDNDKLYLSWDGANWHSPRALRNHLRHVNSSAYREANGTPAVELAPLPSSTQYLNVIESVFSGMARAIIHNSDYGSLAECRAALDRYITERNAHSWPTRNGQEKRSGARRSFRPFLTGRISAGTDSLSKR